MHERYHIYFLCVFIFCVRQMKKIRQGKHLSDNAIEVVSYKLLKYQISHKASDSSYQTEKEGVDMMLNDEIIMTTEDVASFLKVSRQTVYKLLRNKEIPAMKVQHQYRIVKSELVKWVRANYDATIEF